MTDQQRAVIGGVDTHKDIHVAAVVDDVGRILTTAGFPATAAGYRRLVSWMRNLGQLQRVGVEGTGAYGTGLARHLAAEDIEVVEINRPNRQAPAGGEARATPPMPKRPLVPRSTAKPPERPSPRPGSWSPSGLFGWRSPRCAIPGPASPTRSEIWWSPPLSS